ncbi:hypothetical protein IU470_06955 [Nocardia abscessus]|uniref:Uncharacterized protein n=1 Tax=Nocardia abscessus TaxID=120957 RepID=A0ABS0C558_9NOCA|nr:hypothetical protein [Nocardia abscessus]MBF6224846.1 hypothetical protein [Nocardia abscessus]
MEHSGWSRIRGADATDSWELSGPAMDHWLTKPFDGGRAVIRVIRADGTLRVTLGDDAGRLIRSYSETTDDIGRAKEIAEAGIARFLEERAESQRAGPRR